MSEPTPDPDVVARLAVYYRRSGYVRRANTKRREKEKQKYKKGEEVRLVADTEAELADIRDLLERAGFKLARPFVKAKQWRQPVYGVDAVARFLALVGEPNEATTGRRSKRTKSATAKKPRPPKADQPRKPRGRPPIPFTTRIIFDRSKYPTYRPPANPSTSPPAETG